MSPQLDLPFSGRGTLAEKFAAWAETVEGQEVIRLSEEIALNHLKAGQTVISMARIWETIRATRRSTSVLNNSWRAFVSRRLRELHPDLRDRIKVREQKAA